MMLDMMFQHLGTVQCALFTWLGLCNLYLIKETMSYFLFTKQHIFVQNQLEDLFLKYKQYFRIPWWCVWRFLKMFLLFRSYQICFYFVTWDYKRFYSCDLWSKRLVFPEEIYFSDVYFYLWNIFSKEILENIFLKNICFNIFLKRIIDSYICVSGRKIFLSPSLCISSCCFLHIVGFIRENNNIVPFITFHIF